MRFLCLHGMGTGSKARIMMYGIAAIRHELGDDHTYEFVQGTQEWPMAPVSNANVPHYAYYDYSVGAFIDALDALEKYIKVEGPFDGVLGFSQGAGLAVMYLVRHAHLYPTAPLPFKCAIVISSIGVYDPFIWFSTGHSVELDHMPPGVRKIGIPVALIWGEKDGAESKREGEAMRNLFEDEGVWTFVHGGGHDVPGPNIKDSVKGSVRAIRRAVTQARLSSS
ncbi:uncharacterized protein BDZ99DRAFT_398015 [Mytilinidion resinicola]|uniref:Serine hydrolase domain-containing protein n=1 Tax=Mytilinidion resinicola TaxID=574789 RepID=A0A6A6Y9A2_9PEZI|nr:uncharacterized protein BDZ99DRAFT_398015 [Mytilinidion resinicola]KAF2804407.1 hypothetical protein BDZ99DRAFT_398015 [Mytilinidion resinicola]